METTAEESTNKVKDDNSDKEPLWLFRETDGQQDGNEGHTENLFLTNSPATQDGVGYIQISSLSDLRNITGSSNRVWQLIPSNIRLSNDTPAFVILDQHAAQAQDGEDDTSNESSMHQLTASSSLVRSSKPLPPDAPPWAKLINDCERVGQYYRGWVMTEQDLDLVLTLHKQQTQSFWGTRQSPAGNRPSARMMWKSQYVPFDGMPFINCGSRAVVMECQFGPRRKGSKSEKNAPALFTVQDFKHACPARIYIKKVRKFPEFAIDLTLDKKLLKAAMDKSFSSLKSHGFASGGQDRYYMQLPLESAHEFHTTDLKPAAATVTKTFDLSKCTQLAEPVANKIRELVSSGIHHVTTIRKMLRKYVLKELFDGEEAPPRHNLSYFPTVNDLQNHIHTALVDIESGTLPLREAAMDTLSIEHDHDWCNWSSNINATAQPETVTVTLTQADENGKRGKRTAV